MVKSVPAFTVSVFNLKYITVLNFLCIFNINEIKKFNYITSSVVKYLPFDFLTRMLKCFDYIVKNIIFEFFSE